MLVEFSVTNYRSFRDRATLSMVAAKPSEDASGRLFVADERSAKPLRLLRSAVVYGPNAGGKSNLVAALATMKAMVVGGHAHRPDLRRLRIPFRLDPACASQPTQFEVTLYADGERYTYGFSLSTDAVTEEWLYAGLPRTRLLFHRIGPSVSPGATWRGGVKGLADKTRADTLFLTVADAFNNPSAAPVVRWFADTLHVADAGSPALEEHALRQASGSVDFRRRMVDYLDTADLGICDVAVEREEVSPHTAFDGEAAGLMTRLFASGPTPDQLAFYRYRVTTSHTASNGQDVPFDLHHDESDGTQRMFALAGPWISGLDNNHVAVIDEFDARLHSRLSRFLLSTWHGAPSNAQLVLTTHNTDLLEGDLFRADQVWFTEKSPNQDSRLYSLAEFRSAAGRKPHPDDNHRRAYLAGRYGAVPITVG